MEQLGAARQPAQVALGRAVALALYASSNVVLFGLLKRHYGAVCTGSWWSAFLTEPSPYCQLVARALGILQWAPLVAVGVAVGPVAGVPLFGI